MTTPVKLHQVLYVVPDARLIRQRHVTLPEINARVLFETAGSLHDGHPIRSMILCSVIGEDLLNPEMTDIVRTRLRQPEHECPGPSIDFARYLWGPASTEEQQ